MMKNQPQRCARIYHRDREKFRVSSFEFQVVNWNDSTLENSLCLCGECFQIGRLTPTVRNLKLETSLILTIPAMQVRPGPPARMHCRPDRWAASDAALRRSPRSWSLALLLLE